MPSEYPSKPEAERRARESSAPARPSEIESPARRRAGTPIALSGLVQRLAKDLGKDPELLAAQIDPETIRRTKYPVIESRDSEGRRVFKHDPGIVEGRKSTSR